MYSIYYLWCEIQYIHLQVEDLLDEENIEGALHIMEDLVTATELLETPLFPRDLNIAIFIVNITLTQLILNHESNMRGVNISSVSVNTCMGVQK